MRNVWIGALVLAVAGLLAGCSSAPKPTPIGEPVAGTAPKAARGGDSTGKTSPRRLVKNANDPDAAKIGQAPVDTTVEKIQGEKQPSDITTRQGPFETTQWRVKATIESVTHEKDLDYYMVLKGDDGGTTVVEVPDPSLCKGSPMLAQITEMRKKIEEKYHPTSETKVVHDRATITGVGFLGWGSQRKGSGKKSATGYRGPRLMPGTGIDFGG